MANKKNKNEKPDIVITFNKKKREQPLKVDKSFGQVLKAMANTRPITNKKIKLKK